MAGYEGWRVYLSRRSADLTLQGIKAEFRGGEEVGPLRPKPAHEVRIWTKSTLANFLVWASGECDWDIMDKPTAEFVCHCWGMIVNDETIQEALDEFISLVLARDRT